MKNFIAATLTMFAAIGVLSPTYGADMNLPLGTVGENASTVSGKVYDECPYVPDFGAYTDAVLLRTDSYGNGKVFIFIYDPAGLLDIDKKDRENELSGYFEELSNLGYLVDQCH